MPSMGCVGVFLVNLAINIILLTLRYTGGFLKQPTPGGVPVITTSPGDRVINLKFKSYNKLSINSCLYKLIKLNL